MAYTIVDLSGRVYMTSSGPKQPSYCFIENQIIINQFCTDINSYWDGENFIPIPNKPNEFSEFNYETKQWEDFRTLDMFKKSKWEELKNQRQELEDAGFEYKDCIFDSDLNSQTRILNAISLGIPVSWTLKNNSTIDLSVEDLNNLKIVLSTHITSIHERSRTAREKLDSATTIEEVNSIEL